eukprot:SAG31_NODE_29312_length_397_cov_0.788591_1_plen_35_part_01
MLAALTAEGHTVAYDREVPFEMRSEANDAGSTREL